MDHVAHLKPSDGGSAATQCKNSLSKTIFYLLATFLNYTTMVPFLTKNTDK